MSRMFLRPKNSGISLPESGKASLAVEYSLRRSPLENIPGGFMTSFVSCSSPSMFILSFITAYTGQWSEPCSPVSHIMRCKQARQYHQSFLYIRIREPILHCKAAEHVIDPRTAISRPRIDLLLPTREHALSVRMKGAADIPHDGLLSTLIPLSKDLAAF